MDKWLAELFYGMMNHQCSFVSVSKKFPSVLGLVPLEKKFTRIMLDEYHPKKLLILSCDELK